MAPDDLDFDDPDELAEEIDAMSKARRLKRIQVGSLVAVAVGMGLSWAKEPTACEALVEHACAVDHLRIMHCGRFSAAIDRGALSEEECVEYGKVGLAKLKSRLPGAAYSYDEAAARDDNSFAEGLRKPMGK
jgi:hypothetical protein